MIFISIIIKNYNVCCYFTLSQIIFYLYLNYFSIFLIFYSYLNFTYSLKIHEFFKRNSFHQLKEMNIKFHLSFKFCCWLKLIQVHYFRIYLFRTGRWSSCNGRPVPMNLHSSFSSCL